ncbi:membrane protein [Gordonia phage RayTheFireFly]|nr:membrane protein [Gordonia phage RayTheFireFly]
MRMARLRPRRPLGALLREPIARRLRPTLMLLDLLATIICAVGFCWLATTTPPTSR